jgi:single-stranded-DNA-specific exonuclease
VKGQRENIVVYGDFDADGVTSTALLTLVLRALGASVQAYIPHRVDEGYGLNVDALYKLRRPPYNASLVITVDCGIRSVDEVEAARAIGLDIIITDHHSVGDVIPRAHAVINPKLTDCAYNEPMLAGVGVAFRLAEALIEIAANNSREQLPPAERLLDLVAIGTVADLAPLDRPENRALVQAGLNWLNRCERPGLRALMEVAGIKPGDATSESIGFALGPRINAAGRLDSAMTAYRLLTTRDETEAEQIASELQSLNQARQALTREALSYIETELEREGVLDAPLIFAGGPFREGIVGLVAGRLTEAFYRPAVVFHQGEEESRASCRSIPEFDITRALDQCADLLVRHGGHAQAAGFTVRNENLPALRERLTGIAAAALAGQDLQPAIVIDAPLDINDVSLELYDAMAALQPFGHANPAPLFACYGVRVVEARRVGTDSQHLKLKIARTDGRPPVDAIGFRMSDYVPRPGDVVDLAFRPEPHTWNHSTTIELKLEAIQPALPA